MSMYEYLSVLIELRQARHLHIHKLLYCSETLCAILAVGQSANVHDVVADAWHNLDAVVG